jgi:hypothetical protein
MFLYDNLISILIFKSSLKFKKMIKKVLSIIFAAIMFQTIYAAPGAPLHITSPVSGSVFQTDDTVLINYTGGDTAKPVYIVLVSTNPFQFSTEIYSGAYTGGSYRWPVSPVVDSGDYYIYIQSNRGDSTSTWEYGGTITINAMPTIVLTSPNGGETFQDGQQIVVTWKTYHYWLPTVNIIMAHATPDNYLTGETSISPFGALNTGIDTVHSIKVLQHSGDMEIIIKFG